MSNLTFLPYFSVKFSISIDIYIGDYLSRQCKGIKRSGKFWKMLLLDNMFWKNSTLKEDLQFMLFFNSEFDRITLFLFTNEEDKRKKKEAI